MTTIASHLDHTVQLVHAVPGRIRLRTDGDEFEAIAEHLKQQFEPLQSYLEIQQHSTTNSIILQFDPNVLPLPHLLQQLPVQQEQPAMEQTQPTSDQEPLSTNESEQLWSIVRLAVPLLTGYGAVRVLGVSGWLSMPVFLLSDVIARELLKQLEQIAPSPSPSISAPHMSESKGSWWNLIDLSSLFGNHDSNGHTTNGHSSNGHISNDVAQPGSTIGQDTQTEANQTDYVIRHAIPGRIRFNVPRLHRDPDYAQKLIDLVKSDRTVTHVRINRANGSIIIQYQPEQIGEEVMQLRLIGLIQAASFTPSPSIIQEPTQPEAMAVDEPIVSVEEAQETAPSVSESSTTQEMAPSEETIVGESVISAEDEEEDKAIACTLSLTDIDSMAVKGDEAPSDSINVQLDEDAASTIAPELPDISSESAPAMKSEMTSESSELSEALPVLSASALADRLHVSPTTISRHKAKADFPEWSRTHDPEGIAWLYLRKSKQFTAETTSA